MFRHTFHTWLLSNFIHPFLWYVGCLFMNDMGEACSLAPSIVLLGSFFSIPSLLILSALLRPIITQRVSTTTRFYYWLITALIIVVLNSLAAVLLVGEKTSFYFLCTLPATIATVLAICIRRNQFLQLVSKTEKEQYETNMI